jgi:hypothetical protein
MSFPTELLQQLQDTALASAIGESVWLFPTIETIHVLALSLVVGSIAIVDLRLLGWASARRAVSSIAHEVLPWTWAAFVVALISGALLFSSKAVQYYNNIPFRIKIALLLAAGLNMLWFQLRTYRDVALWDAAAKPPAGARWAGSFSLVFWVGVVAAGRWIGFVL